MKSRIIGRAVALAVLSALISWFLLYYQSRNLQMGREEYLAEQAVKFDKDSKKPDSFVYYFIGFMVFGVPLLGVYEGVVWVVSRSLKGMDAKGKS